MRGLTFLALVSLACGLGAFPFWLEAPARGNPFDPKNPAFKPVLAPTSIPAATPTRTPSATATATHTPSATASPAFSPTLSPTPTPTPSESPVLSPTPSPLVTHSGLVMDMEQSGTNDRTLWNDGPVLTVKDSLGSTQSPNPWGPGSAALGSAYGAAGYAACMSGNMLVQIGAPTNQYPFCFIAFELLPSGSAPPSSGGVDTDVTPFSPNSGLKFDYKAGAAGVLYHIKLISTLVTDFGYYEYNFTPADTAWHSVTVYFPTVAGPAEKFSQPSWGTPRSFDPAKIGAIMVEPVPQTGYPVSYDICIDNLTFDVPPAPTPVPTPTPGGGTLIADFENNAQNDVTLAPFSQTISTNTDTIGSSILPRPWGTASGTAPGSGAAGPASQYAGCISGSLVAQDPPGNVYPYAVMELLLAPAGYGNGGGSVDIAPYAPGKRFAMDYKAGTAGVLYSVQLITQNISDYDFYDHWFTPADTAWNTLVVYLPDSSFSPKFAQAGWGAAKPWDPALVGEVLIRPVPVNNSPVNFELCVDNLRFE